MARSRVAVALMVLAVSMAHQAGAVDVSCRPVDSFGDADQSWSQACFVAALSEGGETIAVGCEHEKADRGVPELVLWPTSSCAGWEKTLGLGDPEYPEKIFCHEKEPADRSLSETPLAAENCTAAALSINRALGAPTVKCLYFDSQDASQELEPIIGLKIAVEKPYDGTAPFRPLEVRKPTPYGLLVFESGSCWSTSSDLNDLIGVSTGTAFEPTIADQPERSDDMGPGANQAELAQPGQAHGSSGNATEQCSDDSDKDEQTSRMTLATVVLACAVIILVAIVFGEGVVIWRLNSKLTSKQLGNWDGLSVPFPAAPGSRGLSPVFESRSDIRPSIVSKPSFWTERTLSPRGITVSTMDETQSPFGAPAHGRGSMVSRGRSSEVSFAAV